VQLRKKLGVIHSHVEGLLEQGGIKLSAVVSDLFGVSGWAMLEHIAQGVTDVEVLAGAVAVRGRGTGFRDRPESGSVSERRTVCFVGRSLSRQSGIGGREL
jgi:hypothetical protein